MRVIAILASVIIGAALGLLVGSLLDMAVNTEPKTIPEGIVGAICLVVGAVALPIWVARLVPRSGRGQRRHDQANQRMGDYRQQYPNRVIRRD